MKKTEWTIQVLATKTNLIPNEQLLQIKAGHNGATENNDYSGPGS